jgi:hypothetical protein
MYREFKFEKVTAEEARKVLEPPPPLQVRHASISRQSRLHAVEPIAEPTLAWLASLPAGVAPHELALQFARIANEICRLWKRPSRCERYLGDLILDRRGGRAGFPPAVLRELGILAAHYAEIYPPRRQAWDGIGKR